MIALNIPRACSIDSAEEQPAQAHQVERHQDSQGFPAGAVDPISGLDSIEPGRCQAMTDEQDSVVEAPDDERPGGAVPEAAQGHREHQVAARLELAVAAAAQRDVQIVAEPG